VVVNYANSEKDAAAVVADIAAAGGTAVAVKADVGTVAGVRALFDAAETSFPTSSTGSSEAGGAPGRVHTLVLNAALGMPRMLSLAVRRLVRLPLQCGHAHIRVPTDRRSTMTTCWTPCCRWVGKERG